MEIFGELLGRQPPYMQDNEMREKGNPTVDWLLLQTKVSSFLFLFLRLKKYQARLGTKLFLRVNFRARVMAFSQVFLFSTPCRIGLPGETAPVAYSTG